MSSRLALGALAAAALWAPRSRADVVADWNVSLLEAQARATVGANPAPRALAIAHLAGYDAVSALARTHQPYGPALVPTLPASAEAAFSSAFYRAATALYPAEEATFRERYEASLAALEPGAARDNGVALGSAAADGVLAAREGDGAAGEQAFPGEVAIGKWRPTPRADILLEPLAAAQPFWRSVRPFALESGDQLRPAAPPALSSAEYAAAYEEVRTLGALDGSSRTEEETEIARFWAQATHLPFNAIARSLAERDALPLEESARLFAVLNVALADSRIAVWDTKYEYGVWRPVTAIQEPTDDGNPATIAQPGWVPLLETPNHPSFASGHSTTGAAGAEVLSAFFGEAVSFDVSSSTLPGVVRSFDSFQAAAAENADSRIYGGIHWRFDNEIGLALGAEVGRYATEHALLPLAGGDGAVDEAGASSGCGLAPAPARGTGLLLAAVGLAAGARLRRPRRSARRASARLGA